MRLRDVLLSATMAGALATTALVHPAFALDNGQAKTPPMGWNSWNQVRCYQLNEELVKRTADAMQERYADAGYSYVVVDDCYQGGRGEDGVLFSHPDRFPSGMQALGDYIHARGLKYGVYMVPGSETCANYWDRYPIRNLGSYGHEELDAQTLETWGVDFLKYDWCRADETNGLTQQAAFNHMRDELAKLNRPIVYGISEYGVTRPWTWAQDTANMWRTTHDINSTWGSVTHIINSQAGLSTFAGPGHWNDPDMLQVGNGEFAYGRQNYLEKNRSHFAMWSMLAAPLMLGTDIAALDQSIVDIVTNKGIIAIDQDSLGNQADRVAQVGSVSIWARRLSGDRLAVAFFNSGRQKASDVSVSFDQLQRVVGDTQNLYSASDAWTGNALGAAFKKLSSGEIKAYDTNVFILSPEAQQTEDAFAYAEDTELSQNGSADVIFHVYNSTAEALENAQVQIQSDALPSGVTLSSSTLEFGTVEVGRDKFLSVSAQATGAAAGNYTVPFVLTYGNGKSLTFDANIKVSSIDWSSTFPLTDVPFNVDTYTWRNPQVNKNVAGKKLTVDGVDYENGIGMNATSKISFDLAGRAKRLTGIVALDDDIRTNDPGYAKWGAPSFVGKVIGDGRVLWESGVIGWDAGMQNFSRKQDFDVDLTGIKKLTIVADKGERDAYDHADFLNLMITGASTEDGEQNPELELPDSSYVGQNVSLHVTNLQPRELVDIYLAKQSGEEVWLKNATANADGEVTADYTVDALDPDDANNIYVLSVKRAANRPGVSRGMVVHAMGVVKFADATQDSAAWGDTVHVRLEGFDPKELVTLVWSGNETGQKVELCKRGNANADIVIPQDLEGDTVTVTVKRADSSIPDASFSFNLRAHENEWTEPLSMNSWIEGETAAVPSAKATYGTDTVSYSYYTTDSHEELESAPTTAGNYIVKASIAATKQYGELSDEVPFSIYARPQAASSSLEATDPATDLANGVYVGDELVYTISNISLPKTLEGQKVSFYMHSDPVFVGESEIVNEEAKLTFRVPEVEAGMHSLEARVGDYVLAEDSFMVLARDTHEGSGEEATAPTRDGDVKTDVAHATATDSKIAKSQAKHVLPKTGDGMQLVLAACVAVFATALVALSFGLKKQH